MIRKHFFKITSLLSFFTIFFPFSPLFAADAPKTNRGNVQSVQAEAATQQKGSGGTAVMQAPASHRLTAVKAVGPFEKDLYVLTSDRPDRPGKLFVYNREKLQTDMKGGKPLHHSSLLRCEIEVGKDPRRIAVKRDGSRVYVTNFGDNSISVIDPKGCLALTPIRDLSGPKGIAYGEMYGTPYLYYTTATGIERYNLKNGAKVSIVIPPGQDRASLGLSSPQEDLILVNDGYDLFSINSQSLVTKITASYIGDPNLNATLNHNSSTHNFSYLVRYSVQGPPSAGKLSPAPSQRWLGTNYSIMVPGENQGTRTVFLIGERRELSGSYSIWDEIFNLPLQNGSMVKALEVSIPLEHQVCSQVAWQNSTSGYEPYLFALDEGTDRFFYGPTLCLEANPSSFGSVALSNVSGGSPVMMAVGDIPVDMVADDQNLYIGIEGAQNKVGITHIRGSRHINTNSQSVSIPMKPVSMATWQGERLYVPSGMVIVEDTPASSTEKESAKPAQTCTDSDGGFTPRQRGRTSVIPNAQDAARGSTAFGVDDSCSGPTTLMEQQCPPTGSGILGIPYECTQLRGMYSCENGACSSNPAPISCRNVPSLPTHEMYLKGETSIIFYNDRSQRPYHDRCADSRTLTETFCSGGAQVGTSEYLCTQIDPLARCVEDEYDELTYTGTSHVGPKGFCLPSCEDKGNGIVRITFPGPNVNPDSPIYGRNPGRGNLALRNFMTRDCQAREAFVYSCAYFFQNNGNFPAWGSTPLWNNGDCHVNEFSSATGQWDGPAIPQPVDRRHDLVLSP